MLHAMVYCTLYIDAMPTDKLVDEQQLHLHLTSPIRILTAVRDRAMVLEWTHRWQVACDVQNVYVILR